MWNWRGVYGRRRARQRRPQTLRLRRHALRYRLFHRGFPYGFCFAYGFGNLRLWSFRFCRDARLFLNGCGAVRTARLAPLAASRATEDLAQLLRHVVVN